MIRTEHNSPDFAFPFVEYSPKNKRENMPIIIQLHGAGERGIGGDELSLVDVHGFSHIIKDRDIDCIFIMPQCPEKQFWAGRAESVIAFVRQIIEAYRADKSRIYLTGLSMGGYGTWFSAMLCPELFTAIAPVCGGGMAWCASVLDMPVWAFHGDCDPIVSVNQSREMVEKLKAQNKTVRYTEFKGAGHDIAKMSFTDELLDWLLAQKRS